MTSSRTSILIVVATVLLTAGYTTQEALWMGILVAVVGLAAATLRPVLGIPASVGMSAASLHAPALAVIAIAAFLFLVWVAIKLPDVVGMPADGGT